MWNVTFFLWLRFISEISKWALLNGFAQLSELQQDVSQLCSLSDAEIVAILEKKEGAEREGSIILRNVDNDLLLVT